MRRLFIGFLFLCAGFSAKAQRIQQTQVLIIGGSTGGTAAAIQSARSGAKTILVEMGPWLGGMLTAAGVSCTDGNDKLPSGIWNEFREACYKHYGTRKLNTGWVSNFNFEPHVGDSIFKAMAAAEKNLTVIYNQHVVGVFVTRRKSKQASNGSVYAIEIADEHGQKQMIKAHVFVDATDLGDVLEYTGLPYRKGLEQDAAIGEVLGVHENSGIIQDMTYVAILKDYGKGADKTIPKPYRYDPTEFDCCNNQYCHHTNKLYSNVDAKKMLEYGRLPNNKFMINWPANGNDFYTDIIGKNTQQRLASLDSARQKTLRFVYFIQQELGFKHLGIADDEFNTEDGLAYIPYHREGRRIIGEVTFTIPHILNPFHDTLAPLYRTGISVGDYPIDHHHHAYPGVLPNLYFPPVPSFSIPIGSLIPKSLSNFIVCDKPISVSNAANGTTRLQPVVLLTGQAAGVLAATAALKGLAVRNVDVRSIQSQLLEQGAMLLPYLDVLPSHIHWKTIQQIGATGILRGTGKSVGWANQTWFYPDSLLRAKELKKGLDDFFGFEINALPTASDSNLSTKDCYGMLLQYRIALQKKYGKKLRFATLKENQWAADTASINRTTAAEMIAEVLDPFHLFSIGLNGKMTGPAMK